MSTQTTATTESEAKSFVDQAADLLFAEFGGRHLFLSIHTSRYAGGPEHDPAKYALGMDDTQQITAATFAELVENARSRNSPEGKIARAAELRKQADELEASIQQEVAT